MTNKNKVIRKVPPNLADLRKEMGFGVHRFALYIRDMTGTWIAPNIILAIEKGRMLPSARVWEALAQVIGFDDEGNLVEDSSRSNYLHSKNE